LINGLYMLQPPLAMHNPSRHPNNVFYSSPHCLLCFCMFVSRRERRASPPDSPPRGRRDSRSPAANGRAASPAGSPPRRGRSASPRGGGDRERSRS
jgi:hypothetical protein